MAVGGSIGGAGFNQGGNRVLDAEIGAAAAPGTPYWQQVMSGLPSTAQTIATTGFRGSGTILRGGWKDTPGMFTRARRHIPLMHRSGELEVGGAIRNNNFFSPRTWTRYGSQDMFFAEGAVKRYSPFQAAGLVNWAAKGGYLGKGLGAMAAEEEGGVGTVMGGGVFGQLAAGVRAGGMGELSGRTARGMEMYAKRAGLATPTTGAEARTAIHMSMTGPVGQRIGGYAEGLRSTVLPEGARAHFETGFKAANRALGEVGGLEAEQITGKIGMRAGYGAIRNAVTGDLAKATAKKAGVELGAEALEKFGMKAGIKTAAALGVRAGLELVPGLNIAMTAWMAYDLTKALVPATGKFLADTYKSYTGADSRKMFGGGSFKMNEAGMTARSRGVAAIQNSRLNARSVLGSEAGGLAQYYG